MAAGEGTRVRFRFYLTAREVIGSRELDVEVPGDTLADAIRELRGRLGAKASVLFDGDGNLKSHYSILIDGNLIRPHQWGEVKLRRGMVIDVIPPVGGG